MFRPELAPEGLSIDAVAAAVRKTYGAIDAVEGPFLFSFTDYYEPEMGPALLKAFFAVAGAHARDSLVGHKHAATALEDRFLEIGGARRLNIDPMLVTVENVVIATSKNFTHRVYLGDGVFADLALVSGKGGYQPLPWTYADYSAHLMFFNGVRKGLTSREARPRT